ncbi:hypothetical protein NQ317_012285 [Molorchus minor]|uniref:Uncharacterized protein n=1 Tax=Molorchus minor TaxID=1323400 RepID=A0ABQ9K2D2_9CUCU|nr:hypothetical protein NQ317_012285 [Molorchus minor]
MPKKSDSLADGGMRYAIALLSPVCCVVRLYRFQSLPRCPRIGNVPSFLGFSRDCKANALPE